MTSLGFSALVCKMEITMVAASKLVMMIELNNPHKVLGPASETK